MSELPTLKSIDETAEILRVSRHTVYRLIGKNELSVTRISERTMILADPIRALIDRNTVEARAP